MGVENKYKFYDKNGLMVETFGYLKGKPRVAGKTYCVDVKYTDTQGLIFITKYCNTSLYLIKDYSDTKIRLEYYVNDPQFVFFKDLNINL